MTLVLSCWMSPGTTKQMPSGNEEVSKWMKGAWRGCWGPESEPAPGGSHHSTLSIPTQGVVLRLLNFVIASNLRKTPMKSFCIVLCAVLSCSVISNFLWPSGPTRLLCPWGFSRREYWSGLQCPPPGDLPDPGIEPMSLLSPALQVASLPFEPSG